MNCQTHDNHLHIHSADCGHTAIKHGDHIDYLHDGHLHFAHDGHFDEHIIEVSDANPNVCAEIACECSHQKCDHETVPHGDHFDYLVNGYLHHVHNGHCDNHGAVAI